MVLAERSAPSLDEARTALAEEWLAVGPNSPDEIHAFYENSVRLRDDLEAWHATEGRQEATRMILHVADHINAQHVVDIGCGAGHDLRELRAAGVPIVEGVEPNHALGFALLADGIQWRTDVADANIEHADLLICVDVLEHVPEPEVFLDRIASRAKIGALLFETTATFDAGTPLHLKANRAWMPGRVLERNGWILQDEVDNRVRVWERIEQVGSQRSSILLCAYKLDRYFQPAMGLTGRGKENGPWRFRAKSGDALISRSRAIIVSNWWAATNDDTFLMVDDDIGFQPQDADRAVELCRSGYDIVCGAYPVHNGEHFALKCFAGNNEINFGPGYEPIEIEYAATGFMACHRRVIDALVKTVPLCHSATQWAHYPLFNPMVVPDESQGGWANLSEDWGFSYLARQAGFKIWLDPQTKLQHGSNIPVSVVNMGLVRDAVKRA